MYKQENLRLLIVDENSGNCASLEKILANAQLEVEVVHAADITQFNSELSGSAPDIVLCAHDSETVDLQTVAGTLQESELRLPVLAIADETSEAMTAAAITSGAAALVSCQQPAHLLQELTREAAILQMRKKLVSVEAALEECENRCTTLIGNSRDAIITINEDLDWQPNQSCLDLFGFSSLENAQKISLTEIISPGQQDKFETDLLGLLENGDCEETIEFSCTSADGGEFETIMHFTRTRNSSGKSCIQILFDAGRQQSAEKKTGLETAENIDTLTRLYNRQHFMDLLRENVDENSTGEEVRALIYLTLDGFKELREENGIAASDKVLCNVARLLESRTDTQDSIARFGDYSYAILFHADSNEKVQALGEKLLQDIPSQLLEIYGKSFAMTCSIGVCAITGHAIEAEKILSHADTACEVARSSGGNSIHTHSAVIDEQLSEGHEKERDEAIRKTIVEKRFYLAYQPIISLTGNTDKRYEALLRVLDEEGHSILPGQFLELAEKAALSSEIDYWIFDTAFSRIAELRGEDKETTVFLKISRSTLADPQLPAWILEKLKEYKLSPASVVFQIQELDSINDLKSAITFVKAMKKIKCKVALEHFGINDQPQLLKHVPADILKIDGSLCENLSGSKEKQSRIKKIVKVAHDLGVQCVAERVDNPGSLAILWQNEVDLIQGNFVQEPDRELDYDFDGEIA